MSDIINNSSFTPGQQEDISKIMDSTMQALCHIVPQLGGHFLSGGTFDVKTMSGLHLRFGFEPQRGGLIIPGGIQPHSRNGGLIK